MIVRWILLCIVFIGDVTPWTVDLSEVEKYVESGEERAEDEVLYNYAESFGYQTFKENKVNVTRVLSNGSSYLEGLSRALMEYRDTLGNCVKENETESDTDSSSVPEESETCKTARKNREYVQKLSDLALITTNKLRDKAYSSNKTKSNGDENEMLLQLAWFLDRLALVTGFEPNPKQYVHSDIETTTRVGEKSTERDDTHLELLEQVESKGALSKLTPKLSPLTAVTSVRRKRSVNGAWEEMLKYYVKYKIWHGDNYVRLKENNCTIKSVGKRDVNKNPLHTKIVATDNKRRVLNKIKIVKNGNDLKFQNNKVKVFKRKLKINKHVLV